MNTNRLERDFDNKMVAGVAAGLADYFQVDPVIVRIAFVLLTILNGIGLLMYLVLWAITPKATRTTPALPPMGGVRGYTPAGGRQVRFDPMTGAPLDPEERNDGNGGNGGNGEDEEIPVENLSGERSTEDAERDQMRRNWILGGALVLVGGLLLVKSVLPFIAPFLVPLALIGAGAYLIVRNQPARD